MTEPHHRCQNCGFEVPLLVANERALANDARRISELQRQITQLRSQQHKNKKTDPFYEEACQVFDYWRRVHSPRAKEFTDERLVHVLARLNAGWTVDDLKKAIDGARTRPYKGRKRTELTTICRNEANLQMFLDFSEPAVAQSTGPVIPKERLAAMQSAIEAPAVLDRLAELRGWSADAIADLGLGLDQGRVVFPIHDATGKLVGLAKYQPNPAKRNGTAKMLAQGTRDLFPAPEVVTANYCWLVEGEPDAVAVRTAEYPAVAVPGVGKWRSEWAPRFGKFDRVLICLDCDSQGRDRAAKLQAELGDYTAAQVIDLDPGREDGFDVGDLLMEVGISLAPRLTALVAAPSSTVAPIRRQVTTPDEPRERPFDLVCHRLEQRGCEVRHKQPGHAEAQCPAHDDRHPSLSVTEGDDERVLVHCQAGCEPERVAAELGLEMRELFAA